VRTVVTAVVVAAWLIRVPSRVYHPIRACMLRLLMPPAASCTSTPKA